MVKETTIVLREIRGVPNRSPNIQRTQRVLIAVGFLPLPMLIAAFWIMHAESWYIFAISLPVAISTLSLVKTILSWTDPTRRYRYSLDEVGIRIEYGLQQEKSASRVLNWKDVRTISFEKGGVTLQGKRWVTLPISFECFESADQRDETIALVERQAVNATRKAIE